MDVGISLRNGHSTHIVDHDIWVKHNYKNSPNNMFIRKFLEKVKPTFNMKNGVFVREIYD